MEYTTKEGNNAKYEALASGLHLAKIISVVDGRYEKKTYNGEFKGWEKRIFILFEIEEIYSEGTLSGKHKVIYKEYAFSAYEKSNLRKDLESLRGKPFVEKINANKEKSLLDDTGKPFNFNSITGQYCFINIVNVKTKAGNDFSKIDSISSYKEAMGNKFESHYEASFKPDRLVELISKRPIENPNENENTRETQQEKVLLDYTKSPFDNQFFKDMDIDRLNKAKEYFEKPSSKFNDIQREKYLDSIYLVLNAKKIEDEDIPF